MLNKYKQKRKEQWLQVNSIRQNQSYIKKVLNKFGFTENEGFETKINNTFETKINSFGDLDIYLTTNIGKTYRIVMDEDNFSYNILGERFAVNPTHKPRYYTVESIQSDDAIMDVMKYINDKIMKLINKN